MTPSPLISATELADLLDGRSRGRPIVLDVRWQLGLDDGYEQYLSGHIPGALYVDLPTQLAGRATPAAGRHPLPAPAAFEKVLQSLGVRQESTVVVYDDWSAQSAARAWWLLTAAGIGSVRVLDGGLASWRAAGQPLESGEVTAIGSTVRVDAYRSPTLTIDEAAALPQHGVLLDARAAERFRGDVEPVDPVAGHIPGAINAPATGNLDASGRFLPPQELRERFEDAGVRADAPLGVYCGSGVTASHNILALTIVGFNAALYPGSWSQWSHTDRPVATGDQPG
nr:sulfurtransferase [Homoserinimonas sp. OAct 916]